MNTSLWHQEILPSDSHKVLRELISALPLSEFYLAGGTGLALLYGHRLSRDFDFFSAQLFDEDSLIQCMQWLHDLTIVAKSEHTVHITLKSLKVSFLGYSYPLLFPMKQYRPAEGVSIDVADERDIACMKISAISSRGTRRDFVDLYEVARQYSLPELYGLFQKKFFLAPYNNVHILKSLTYFADAESEPMPNMLIPLSWDTVKQYFVSEVPKFL